ncbi:bifunctional adenosylcobinamide kinase/adenosylcobinamide-phosphate guanylyltransferase [Ideonella sp. 4Y16]|uniref:bifunctional adenosylcobinamide kinase/adenosylcobinamide-phosphate guanylyltransferase n=1 Tax=Ideonella alba TaxID=2824118 RepID=UPI001B392EE9|nr:bifunctional adenosylcobinamide kinase/adenosylcobinamide-phosphate guanylyltransferase [Ideonella alba]MBQ0945770.1 bifunctional adenosylcobinamide kinase/adenosylcobinamide-phosphate guanylyltransferase [Ideonella alba]
MKTLILGGARSGKSRLAEELAHRSGRPVTVIATAQALDAEMAQRIAAHRAARLAHWRCVEEPLALAAALQAADAPGALLLVDCLTLWLSNLLHAGDERFTVERAALLDAITPLQADLLLVGNEVGHGIVPLGPLSRRFVDENGWLHQALAERCDAVRFVMAGCVLPLKG